MDEFDDAMGLFGGVKWYHVPGVILVGFFFVAVAVSYAALDWWRAKR